MGHPVETCSRWLEMKDYLSLGKYRFEIICIDLIVGGLGMEEITAEYKMRTEVLAQTYNDENYNKKPQQHVVYKNPVTY